MERYNLWLCLVRGDPKRFSQPSGHGSRMLIEFQTCMASVISCLRGLTDLKREGFTGLTGLKAGGRQLDVRSKSSISRVSMSKYCSHSETTSTPSK